MLRGFVIDSMGAIVTFSPVRVDLWVTRGPCLRVRNGEDHGDCLRY